MNYYISGGNLSSGLANALSFPSSGLSVDSENRTILV